MHRSILYIIIVILLWMAKPVEAAGTTFGVRLGNNVDGSFSSEFIYNNQIFWRIAVLVDGSTPVFAFGDRSTTFVIPAIENGCFVLKVR